jgi:hypothetical protein
VERGEKRLGGVNELVGDQEQGEFRERERDLVGGMGGEEDGKRRTRKPRRAIKERVPPRQMGSIAMSKGPYLEPISKRKTVGVDGRGSPKLEG